MGVLTEAIESYTGLSPTALFTILALMFGVYRLVCGMFVDPIEAATEKENLKKPQPPSVSSSSSAANSDHQNPITNPTDSGFPAVEHLGEVTEEELRAYDGSDLDKPLLMAIKGQIYDVSPSRMFYGPGGPYALFAGRDASRALALMSFDPNDLTGNIEGLDPPELEVLQDWKYKFEQKYAKVGKLVTERTREDNTESVCRTDGKPEAQSESPL